MTYLRQACRLGTIVLVLAAAPAGALEVTYLGDLEFDIGGWDFPEPVGDCLIGVTDPPTGYVEGWDGPDYDWLIYYQTLRPWTHDCPCDEGWQVTTVHFIVAYLDSVPRSIGFSLSLEMMYEYRNMYNYGHACWVPAELAGSAPIDPLDRPFPIWCSDDHGVLDLEAPGYYHVEFPMQCECRPFHSYHFLEFSSHEPALASAVDSNEGECSGLFIGHFGGVFWWDDADLGYSIWADVECCESPVTIRSETWGTIKSLFR